MGKLENILTFIIVLFMWVGTLVGVVAFFCAIFNLWLPEVSSSDRIMCGILFIPLCCLFVLLTGTLREIIQEIQAII